MNAIAVGIIALLGAILAGGSAAAQLGLFTPPRPCDGVPVLPQAHAPQFQPNGTIQFLIRSDQGGRLELCLHDAEGVLRWKTTGLLVPNFPFTREAKVVAETYYVTAFSNSPPSSLSTTLLVLLDQCENNSYRFELGIESDGEGMSMSGGTGAACEEDQTMEITTGLGPQLEKPAGLPGMPGAGLDDLSLVGGAGVIGAALSLSAAWSWPRTSFAAAALFTRLLGPRVMDHEIRARLVDLVRQEPGIRGHAAARRLEIPNGQAAHHFRVLVREGVLSRIGVFGGQSYFLRGKQTTQEMRAVASLRSTPLRRLYEDILEHPEQPITEAAFRLGLSPPRVSRLARRLENVGLVERRRVGRSVRLRAHRLVHTPT